MDNLIVFESTDEVIVGNAAAVNELIKFWFFDGLRNLDDYNTYIVKGEEGVCFSSNNFCYINRTEIDVTKLMSDELIRRLTDSGLLTFP